MPSVAFSNLISSLLPRGHVVSRRDPKSLLENLFCCAAASAVIHVDILHGDEGDPVFLSVGRGTAEVGRSPVYREKGTEQGGKGNLGASYLPSSFQTNVFRDGS